MISSLNLHVSWKPVNPQECVWKKLYRNIIIAGKGVQFTTALQFVTQIFLCLKQWRYPQQKQQRIKTGRNLKIFWRGTKQVSETNLMWLMKQEKKVEKYTSPHWWTSVFEECRIGDKAPKIQRSSCTPRRHCERWFWILCSIHRARIISITNDGIKSDGYHLQIAGLRRTSSWRSICWNPGQNGRCTQIIENSQIGMYVDDIKLAWKKQNINPMWKVLKKGVDLGEPTSFLDHVYLGCTQRQCEISKDIVDNSQNHVWIQNFLRGHRKITMLGKSAYFFMVLWHGRSCEEMCGAILWVSKHNDSTTLESIYSMHWRPPLERGSIEICWRIVKSMLSNCSEMLMLGTNWKTWYSMVSEKNCEINYKRPMLVTNAWIDWHLTSITHVNINSIVMWVILLDNAGWDCFKTPILREILRTQNLLQVEHCVFSEATRSFQSAGCVRNKLQFRTAQQNQKSFPWMQV